ncbi:ty3-gypsy retrotransposon protein [Cucumis melo var. makuwa]|uniref:Ty3-gypsy retrotransposon protein n=1 Tax=Cucumis melo var. makuwa TaxID=1194695 RepID=A0A5A7SX63_CUCMM|nr:ty3-gypsy retrotransposon protein [Cucumis melo var. makuwa]TYK21813.1 ty3-gypsy retrotransposon protein [Cucumis melo var. makuwa]
MDGQVDTRVDCFRKEVVFNPPIEARFKYKGVGTVVDTRRVKVSWLSEPVVKEYYNIFPEELPGLPSHREIDFAIKLEPHIVPISKVSCKMASIELKELKVQLQEFLDKVFSKINLLSEYHQLKIKDNNVSMIDFRSRYGHYEFIVMSFGLNKNSSVYGRDEQIFYFLGHVVSKDGISMDAAKIKVVTSGCRPSTISKVRSFLGLAGYFDQERNSIIWSKAYEDSFKNLKQKLVAASILTLLDGSRSFMIYSDA